MRHYRFGTLLGLGLGVSAWLGLADEATAQHRPIHQQPRPFFPQQQQQFPMQPQFPMQQQFPMQFPRQPIQHQPRQQPHRPARPVQQPQQPRFQFPARRAAQPNNNNPAAGNNFMPPIIGGQMIRSPFNGTMPIQGNGGGYLGSLANTGYLGGFGGFNSPFFGNPFFNSYGSPFGAFGQFNPYSTFGTFGNPWLNPWTSSWGNPWASPFNQYNSFSLWGNPFFNAYGMNPYAMNPYAMNAFGMNPFAMNAMAMNQFAMNPFNVYANPFQMALPQNGPFAPMAANPFFQQANAMLAGGGGLGGFGALNGGLNGGAPVVGVGAQQAGPFQLQR